MERFPDGARVCFVGDSITHANGFVSHIVAYYRRNFPNSGIEFYNCGISGGNLGNTIGEYDDDIALYDPTHIVLMIGVNDSGRTHLLTPSSKEKYDALTSAYERYKANVHKFYELLCERGIKLILCTPVPYAEYQEGVQGVLPGGYALMLGYADFIKEFAKEHSLPLCDYHSEITIALQSENLYAPDGVHPTEMGHYYMAKAFLKSQGLDLGEKQPYPEDMKDWIANVAKLRDVIATEYFIVPQYFELPDGERIAKVKERQDAVNAGTAQGSDYLKGLMTRYFENKPKQKELVDFVKSFMKNQ